MRCNAKNSGLLPPASSLSSWQQDRFLAWVMEDQGDYCCCEVRFYRADPDERKAYYRCPVCNEEWDVECPDWVL